MPALLLLFGIFGLAILPHVFLAILEFLRQCVSSLFLASHDDDPVIEAWFRHALANTLRYGGVAVAALAYSLSCDAEGAERMRANVCEVEWLLLTGARLFHACQYASLLLYHLVDADAVLCARESARVDERPHVLVEGASNVANAARAPRESARRSAMVCRLSRHNEKRLEWRGESPPRRAMRRHG